MQNFVTFIEISFIFVDKKAEDLATLLNLDLLSILLSSLGVQQQSTLSSSASVPSPPPKVEDKEFQTTIGFEVPLGTSFSSSYTAKSFSGTSFTQPLV